MKSFALAYGFFVAALMVAPGIVLGDEADNGPGAKLYIEYKCQSCHSIQSKGIGIEAEEEEGVIDEFEEDGWGDDGDEEDLEAPDLSGAGLERDSEWLHLWLRKKTSTEEGNKHKKRFKGTKEERTVLVDWLLLLRTPVPEPDQG